MKFRSKFINSISYRLQSMALSALTMSAANAKISKKKSMAGLLSKIAFDLLGIRKKYMVQAIRTSLRVNESEAEDIARKSVFTFVFNCLEMSKLCYFSEKWLENVVRPKDMINLQNALARKCGVIIVSGHFGLWELIPPWLSLRGHIVNTVVRRQNNPLADKWMDKMRTRFGAETTDSGYSIRKILRTLKQNKILALMVDQDNGDKGIFVPFFDRPASAPTGPAVISLKTGAPIVPLFLIPDYCGKHKLVVHSPIYPEDYSNDSYGQWLITKKYTQILQSYVKKYPHQWFWLHRRWKTTLDKAPDNPWAAFCVS